MFQHVTDTLCFWTNEDENIQAYPRYTYLSTSEFPRYSLFKTNNKYSSNQYINDTKCLQNHPFNCQSLNTLEKENSGTQPENIVSFIELKCTPQLQLSCDQQLDHKHNSLEMCNNVAAAEPLSEDLTELSWEELCTFPMMSAIDVDQLYEEHQKVSTMTSNATSSSIAVPKSRARKSKPCLKRLKRNPANKQHQLLWQFLYAAASEPRFKTAIEMEDRFSGTFAIKNKQHFEEAWATFKGSVKRVPYEYITRNMRYLYKPPHHFLSKVVGQQHKYQFIFQNIERCYGQDWKQVVAHAARNLLHQTSSSSNSRFSTDMSNFYCE